MTQTPRYGIWTTDISGFRVAGFTPAQMLAVTQERDELLAALQNFVKEFEGCYADGEPAMIAARAAIQKATNKEQA